MFYMYIQMSLRPVVGPTGVKPLDFLLWYSVVCTVESLSLLHLIISILYLDSYVLGDDSWIS